MIRPRITALGTATAVLLVAAGVGASTATARTERISLVPGGAPADGVSTHPAITADGAFVAFESTASHVAGDTNGSIRDVFVRDRNTGVTSLVSVGFDGTPASGVSQWPAISDGAQRIAFRSAASNLVPGDTNGVTDIFTRDADGTMRRVSVASTGEQADDESRDVDISADGRYVAFSSRASNLVAGDTNDVEDIFLHDVQTGTTTMVSMRDGKRGNDRSRAPAISPDGRFVSFYSTATNLVGGDRNRTGDVFLADTSTGSIELASQSNGGRRQNASVVRPFAQVSDVSRGGQFVVFDSDASNLVGRDRNRDTDVFVRDMVNERTRRISVSNGGREADNDSFSPSISSDGRFVTFESFAGNLYPRDPKGEDVFLYDRALRTMTIVDVTAAGRPRRAETVRQLLQRPVVTDAGDVAFTSTSPGLTPDDQDPFEDVFLRRTAPPDEPAWVLRADNRGRYRLRSDDPGVALYLCRVAGQSPYICRSSGRVPGAKRRPRRLVVRAGGPGLRFSDWRLIVRVGRGR